MPNEEIRSFMAAILKSKMMALNVAQKRITFSIKGEVSPNNNMDWVSGNQFSNPTVTF